MARINRREVLSAGEIQVVHCVNRCVRKSFLCGTDPLTGDDYEHRREWIRNRLEFLAGIFGIDILGVSVMSNHLHAILRNRPDVMKDWSDEEVARRRWNLFPSRRNKDGSPAEPAETDLKSLMTDAKTLLELRARLSSISWFMLCTSEVIARLANAEENCSGRFGEGRFKATILPDESAIAACMVYVDLNPVRAGIAATPEESDLTSVQERVADLKSADEVSTPDAKDARIEHGKNAGWLAPVELEPKRKKARERGSSRRASNKGCVFMSLAEYLELLDWTGRQVHPGKRGSVARKTPPILDRLNLSPEFWLQTIAGFGKRRSANSVTPASRFNAAVLPGGAICTFALEQNVGDLTNGTRFAFGHAGEFHRFKTLNSPAGRADEMWMAAFFRMIRVDCLEPPDMITQFSACDEFDFCQIVQVAKDGCLIKSQRYQTVSNVRMCQGRRRRSQFLHDGNACRSGATSSLSDQRSDEFNFVRIHASCFCNHTSLDQMTDGETLQ